MWTQVEFVRGQEHLKKFLDETTSYLQLHDDYIDCDLPVPKRLKDNYYYDSDDIRSEMPYPPGTENVTPTKPEKPFNKGSILDEQ